VNTENAPRNNLSFFNRFIFYLQLSVLKIKSQQRLHPSQSNEAALCFRGAWGCWFHHPDLGVVPKKCRICHCQADNRI